MSEVVEAVVRRTKLPRWWVEAIAVEYADCREYATRDEIWTFDFDRLSERDLEEAVLTHRVVVHGIMMHNILPDVWGPRSAERLFSNVPVQLAEVPEDVMADGPVSDFYFPFLPNPIQVWDPKLNFSSHFQVLDNGRFWQWRIARFEKVKGRSYGKWVSSEVDLKPLDKVHGKLASLRNPVIKPGDPGHDDFKEKVEGFYEWLDTLRHPILRDLEEVHTIRRAKADSSKVAKSKPRLLSRFETFTVQDGVIHTKFFAEPVFFRGCCQHATRAEELLASTQDNQELVTKLDEVYQERASAVISGATCVEAFINGLGYERFPELWKNMEKLPLGGKWQLYLTLAGKADMFDPGKEPYQSLFQLIRSRNALVHFKRQYHQVRLINNKVETALETELPREFVRNLPDRLRQLIQELCEATAMTTPSWLTSEIDLI